MAAYSEANAYESIGEEFGWDPKAQEYTQVTPEKMERFARIVAYKVAYNLRIGYKMDQFMDPLEYEDGEVPDWSKGQILQIKHDEDTDHMEIRLGNGKTIFSGSQWDFLTDPESLQNFFEKIGLDVGIEKVASNPNKRERATELEYLKWFRLNADFGPADGDVKDFMHERFMEETGKNLPDGWNYDSNGLEIDH